jgi:hypothetical protein
MRCYVQRIDTTFWKYWYHSNCSVLEVLNMFLFNEKHGHLERSKP